MREAFNDWEPSNASGQALLHHTNVIIAEYRAQGYVLTLRQLYYQFVARDLIPNTERSYKNLGELVKKGRMAGSIDWSAIVDRGRSAEMWPQWNDPADLITGAAASYRLDRWAGQERYVEVWVEKDALASVVEPACDALHVRWLACRGYSSATAMYDGAERFKLASDDGKWNLLIYLGDHDPSGMDMSRDVADRLDEMQATDVEVHRIALNMDQVDQYDPPPNPTKFTDSRQASYVARFGRESWELDALEPAVMDSLIRDRIEEVLDRQAYEKVVEQEDLDKELISRFTNEMMTERGMVE